MYPNIIIISITSIYIPDLTEKAVSSPIYALMYWSIYLSMYLVDQPI